MLAWDVRIILDESVATSAMRRLRSAAFMANPRAAVTHIFYGCGSYIGKPDHIAANASRLVAVDLIAPWLRR
jgi:hypothetical protein